MNSCKISVIMPALNEENNITRAVENVRDCFEHYRISGEIVVVNDGSRDKTGEIAVSMSERHPFIKVLHHKEPHGIGASFWDGVMESCGEIVMMIPGDGENDACEMLRYLPLMDNVDMVIPFAYNKEVRSLRRRLLSAIYRGIINISFGMLLNYMNGTVMYRKCILRDIDLKSMGFFYQTELLIKCIRKGYLYAEVPYALRQRFEGRSKALTLKSILKVKMAYFTTLANVYLFDRTNKEISPESITAVRWKELGGA